METIQIKTRYTLKVIFEYKAENATLKDAVEEAVRQGINLSFANLSGADLYGANLENAHLENADLKNANLIDAYLEGAYLSFADLIGANLYNAFIYNADLHKANLEGADLRSAYLYGADLNGTKGIPDDLMPLACPTEGSFIAWKKVGNKLVKLEIPEDAKRSSATTNKCRCSKAKVLAITNLGETKTYDEVVNNNYATFSVTKTLNTITYRVGEMVYPDSFDEDRWNECSHGIHFFMDKKDALNW